MFFDKYLRRKSNIDLRKVREEFEVEYVSNVHK
jgi:uncharacterized protein (DUF2164 family)